jgi:DNA-binding MarR family transcriptional regulator
MEKSINRTELFASVMPFLMKTLFKGFTPDLPLPLNDSEGRVLMLVYRMEGLPMKEYTLGMAMNKGTLSRVVDKLVHKGYMERLPQNHDRRILVLKLTQDGKSAVKKLEGSLSRHVEQKLACLTNDERVQFDQAINYIALVTKKINDTETLT